MIKLYFDGGCSKNPGGICSYGVVIYNNMRITKYGRIYQPKKEGVQTTNNLAEYAGLISGLLHLKKSKLDHEEITVFGDSQLVIRQMQGEWSVDPEKPYGYLAVKAKEIIQSFPQLKFKWIPREENYSADKEAESAYLQYMMSIGK